MIGIGIDDGLIKPVFPLDITIHAVSEYAAPNEV
jgi:hypothetical protein